MSLIWASMKRFANIPKDKIKDFYFMQQNSISYGIAFLNMESNAIIEMHFLHNIVLLY